ncbi:MAG: LysR family transcriptional regulator [Cognatishimia sp.]|uniref:LysR family transcriptional regulator n=1 Tax=Cognatishimia sp. TaxID=2211648 RepID=UPI003B8AAF80
MDLKFVESYLLVLDAGSIAAAARKQNITPAAVSQRVTALQNELGVSLVVREGRRMVATSHGRTMIPLMEDMLARRSDINRLLASQELRGVLRVGAISTVLGQFGPQLVKALKAQAPDVNLRLVPGTSEELYEAISQDRIDLAIVASPPFELPKSLKFDRLVSQDIGLFRRRGAPADTPFIVYDRTSWGGATCWKALSQTYSNTSIICEMDAPEVIAQMVEQGLGQAVLPHWQGLHIASNQVEFLSLGAQRTIGVISLQRDSQSALMKLVQEALDIS